MNFYLVLTLSVLSYYAKAMFFNRYPGYTAGNATSPFEDHLNIPSAFMCLAYCQRESRCLTANYNRQLKSCSLYDCRLDKGSLVTQSFGIVYTAKSTNPFNYSQATIKVYSLNGISISDINGITEIMQDTSYFIITDYWRNRVVKLDDRGQFIKSTSVTKPKYITKSHQFIYVSREGQSEIIKLSYDLNQMSTIINDNDMQGIHYDLINNNIYIVSYSSQSIYIYHTNDEVNFTKIATIGTSYQLASITIKNDKIYTGTGNGKILVYNKLNNSFIQLLNMCSNRINSVKFDSNCNMIYSCVFSSVVNLKDINGISRTVSLNGIFNWAYETYVDSRNRLWVGGYTGYAVFN